jgi:hypothetical protein
MKRLIAVAVLTAGCGPMFDSPMAPEPVAWNVTGNNKVMCLQIDPSNPARFLPPKVSSAEHYSAPCPPGWQVPTFGGN